MIKKVQTQNDGYVLPTVLSIMIALIIIMSAVTQLVVSNISLAGNNVSSQRALNIAEAGINYYLWHLSHQPKDFKDGKTTPNTPDPELGYGPYVHDYVDAYGKKIGTYTLWIKPDSNALSSATVRSIGKDGNSGFKRTIQAQIGAPSFASYSLIGDIPVWFGNTESAHGPVHSNIGIRMDGDSDSTVSSANATYKPPDNLGGDGSYKPGVWCSPSVTYPVNCNSRNKSSWVYPVPPVDFNQVSNSLCDIKKIAFEADSATSSLATRSDACSQVPSTRTAAYIPQRASSYSLTKGYLIQLNPNGKYDIFNVNAENDTRASYTSALTLTNVATNVDIPQSGVIFVEDNVWVRSNPTFHGRVTIASARLATNAKTEIRIVDNLAYSTKDGSDAIGLISENNIEIAPYAAPKSGTFTLEINGALLAGEQGRVYFPLYYRQNGDCAYGWIDASQKLSFYGSVATRESWTWLWIVSRGFFGFACGDEVKDPVTNKYYSGFLNNTTEYDYNLKYSPPPYYPLTSTLDILSWREIITKP